MTTGAICDRNRRNAAHSTGPRTLEGKEIARRNSLKHGLCANPATGVVEDADAFSVLHEGLIERFQPCDAVEAGMVHRVAVCLWRLQRATDVEAAASTTAVENLLPGARAQVQDWIEQINAAWQPEPVAVPDHEAAENPEQFWRWKGSWWATRRPGLRHLDDRREQEMMSTPAALCAMQVMLEDLGKRIMGDPAFLQPDDIERVIWLLGGSATKFSPALNARVFPWDQPWASHVEQTLQCACENPKNPPAQAAAEGLIRTRLSALRQIGAACENPLAQESFARQKTVARLPDTAMMDRLLRYETHVDRSLKRAMEMLAQLRGSTIQTVLARLSQPQPDGGVLEVEGRRTQWSSPSPSFCETNPDGRV